MNHRLPTQAATGDLLPVSRTASELASHACILSSRHIQDPMLRLNFNREVAFYTQGIVQDVQNGVVTQEKGMAALLAEKRQLLSQSRELAFKGIGVTAGTLQFIAGAGVCYGSGGLLCPLFGVPLMAHGANNVYENGRNLVERRSDTHGPLRKLYQSAAKLMGRGELEGNLAYGAVDVGTSFYGLGRLVLKPDAWRLFRYVRADYVRVYSRTSARGLVFEAISNGVTLKSMRDEFDKNAR